MVLANTAARLPDGALLCVRGRIEPTKNGHVPSQLEIELLLQQDDSEKTGHLRPTLHFYVGEKVMVTQNISTTHGIANGSIVLVVGVRYAPDVELRQERQLLHFGVSAPLVTLSDTLPECVFVKLLPSSPLSAPHFTLPGLPPDVFPIRPVTESFSTKLATRTLRVSLTQFPFVGIQALTIHKCQGQTLDRVSIARWRDPSMPRIYELAAYVALSRVRTCAGLYIAQRLTSADCAYFVPPLSVLNELERLDALQPAELRTPPDVLAWRRVPAEQRAERQRQQQQPTKKKKKRKSNQ
jgi:hypothetical protein